MVHGGLRVTTHSGQKCRNKFPLHKVHESAGSRSGLKYKAANGELIANLGEVHLQHKEADGSIYDFTFQHAEVHCPIMSVRQLVEKDCEVTFHKYGGYIRYPNNKKVRFVTKGGVFFVLLNILPPKDDQSVFSRPGTN